MVDDGDFSDQNMGRFRINDGGIGSNLWQMVVDKC